MRRVFVAVLFVAVLLTTREEPTEALEEQRRRLSFDALNGKPGALKKLEAVEEKLIRRRLQAERERLGDAERDHRARVEARKRKEAERANATEKLETLRKEGAELAPEGDQLVAALGEWLDRWLANRAEILRATERLSLAVHVRLQRYERDAAWLIRAMLSPKPPGPPRLRRHFEPPPDTFSAKSFGDLVGP